MIDTGIREGVLEEIRNLARRHGIDKVLLFGSRSRGDYRERSDIDLAITGGDAAAFALDVDEEVSTLLIFDVVDLSGDIQPELRESIERDGVTIYEKV